MWLPLQGNVFLETKEHPPPTQEEPMMRSTWLLILLTLLLAGCVTPRPPSGVSYATTTTTGGVEIPEFIAGGNNMLLPVRLSPREVIGLLGARPPNLWLRAGYIYKDDDVGNAYVVIFRCRGACPAAAEITTLIKNNRQTTGQLFLEKNLDCVQVFNGTMEEVEISGTYCTRAVEGYIIIGGAQWWLGPTIAAYIAQGVLVP